MTIIFCFPVTAVAEYTHPLTPPRQYQQDNVVAWILDANSSEASMEQAAPQPSRSRASMLN